MARYSKKKSGAKFRSDKRLSSFVPGEEAFYEDYANDSMQRIQNASPYIKNMIEKISKEKDTLFDVLYKLKPSMKRRLYEEMYVRSRLDYGFWSSNRGRYLEMALAIDMGYIKSISDVWDFDLTDTLEHKKGYADVYGPRQSYKVKGAGGSIRIYKPTDLITTAGQQLADVINDPNANLEIDKMKSLGQIVKTYMKYGPGNNRMMLGVSFGPMAVWDIGATTFYNMTQNPTTLSAFHINGARNSAELEKMKEAIFSKAALTKNGEIIGPVKIKQVKTSKGASTYRYSIENMENFFKAFNIDKEDAKFLRRVFKTAENKIYDTVGRMKEDLKANEELLLKSLKAELPQDVTIRADSPAVQRAMLHDLNAIVRFVGVGPKDSHQNFWRFLEKNGYNRRPDGVQTYLAQGPLSKSKQFYYDFKYSDNNL